MRIRTLEERVIHECELNGIIFDTSHGLTSIAPSVMMFYGVKQNKGLVSMGQGRQRRYLALIGDHIIIELYDNFQEFV